jgi:hypothetical protein
VHVPTVRRKQKDGAAVPQRTLTGMLKSAAPLPDPDPTTAATILVE